ncbi:hypothetical protein SteCoe_15875 [Stentor coeruleus]|uniref:Uncharacterized protein n=1 Tax=Stentor coeruleus TaxID=5963 RepID=A0A1R2C2F7_9CILI|nr:hypothetical protein SteCoe_15875 [Stentor coeruleus]
MEDSLKQIEESIITSNKSAVEHLRKDKFYHAMFFLNQALLTSKSLQDSQLKYNLLALTYNNLGCYLKKINKPLQALEYFTKSSEISKYSDSNTANLTCSHLNISKIYSEQGDHEKSLRHALKSLFLLRHNFAAKKTLVSSLIVAYQTVGFEYKFLNQISDCIDCFETGLNLSMRHLGKSHEMTIALKNNLLDVTGTRPQSNQSKKINHVRGRSAGVNKAVSNTEIPKRELLSAKGRNRVQKTQTRPFEIKMPPMVEERRFLFNVGHIKAAVCIQKWWRQLVSRRGKRKSWAAVRIQKWWRGVRARKYAEKLRVRNKICKRHIIRNSKTNYQSGENFGYPLTKNSIYDKERRLIEASKKPMEDMQKDDLKFLQAKKPIEDMQKDDLKILQAKKPERALSAHAYNTRRPTNENTLFKPINPTTKPSYKQENPKYDNKMLMTEGKLSNIKSNRNQNYRPTTDTNSRSRIRSESAKRTRNMQVYKENQNKASAKNIFEQLPKTSETRGNRRKNSYKKPLVYEIIEASRKKGQENLEKNNSIREKSPVRNMGYAKTKENDKSGRTYIISSLESNKIIEYSPYSSIITSSSGKKPAAGALKPKYSQYLNDNKAQNIKNQPSVNKKNYLEERKADITHQILSLTKVQSFMRMVGPRLRFIKMKKASVCIQRVYRGHLVRKLFQSIRNAVVFIQLMYRKYKT